MRKAVPYEPRRWAGNCRLLPVVCLLLVGISWGQTSQTPTSPKTPQGAVPAPQEKKISPKEAEELFRSVDEILAFVSKDTELPIEHVAARCGFGNPATLRAHFARALGVTPTSYRRSFRTG